MEQTTYALEHVLCFKPISERQMAEDSLEGGISEIVKVLHN